MKSKKPSVNLLCNTILTKNDETRLSFKKSTKRMELSETKEKDNNTTLIEHDDEVWEVLLEDKDDSGDFEGDKVDLK